MTRSASALAARTKKRPKKYCFFTTRGCYPAVDESFPPSRDSGMFDRPLDIPGWPHSCDLPLRAIVLVANGLRLLSRSGYTPIALKSGNATTVSDYPHLVRDCSLESPSISSSPRPHR